MKKVCFFVRTGIRVAFLKIKMQSAQAGEKWEKKDAVKKKPSFCIQLFYLSAVGKTPSSSSHHKSTLQGHTLDHFHQWTSLQHIYDPFDYHCQNQSGIRSLFRSAVSTPWTTILIQECQKWKER